MNLLFSDQKGNLIHTISFPIWLAFMLRSTADPGYSKGRRSRRPMYLFIKDINSNRMRIAQ